MENVPKIEEKMTLERLALMVGKGFTGVDERFDKVEGRLGNIEAGIAVLEVDMREVKSRLDKIEEGICKLTDTLDAFLKRLTDHEDEFKILKDEVRWIKNVMREKLNVDIDTLRHK